MAGTYKTNQLGEYKGERKTFSSAFELVAPTNNTAFVVLAPNGARRVIRLDRIRINNASLTAAQILRIGLVRYTSLPTGGTFTSPGKAPMINNGITSWALLQAYTVAPTGGLATPLVMQSYAMSGVVTGSTVVMDEIYDDYEGDINEDPRVQGATECFGIAFLASPASAVTLTVNITWTEDMS
jgi:hypothetical protein